VYRFPFIASASLLSLFFALQYFKEWVNFLLSLYFSLMGIFALFASFEPYVDRLFSFLPSVMNPAHEFKTRIVIFDIELLDMSLKLSGILALAACSLAAFMPTSAILPLTRTPFICIHLIIVDRYGYFFSQNWLLSNIFGICYALKGLEMLSPGSYKNGFVLLCGLFLYAILQTK
jgi:minor histocompatibility antigen H13